MKRSTRLALSGLVLLVSPVVGLMAAWFAGHLIPGNEVDPGFVEATPVTIVGILGAFVAVTGLCGLLGLRYIWDRRFD